MTPLSRALDLLEAQDARVAAAPQESLCPGRARPTPLRALGLALLPPDVDPARALAWAQGLVEVAQAQREHFPDTIFWDQDLLAASLLRLPSLDALRQVAADIRALQAQFGRRSELCFRYTHDFNYGYDWSRWVAREPARAQVGPFDPPFLAYMKQRGGELVELIAADDAKYHKLPPGTPRNPFGFSREPAAERALFRALAAQDLIPARAWDPHDQPRWGARFAEARAELAGRG
jgi:hypothetical protein